MNHQLELLVKILIFGSFAVGTGVAIVCIGIHVDRVRDFSSSFQCAFQCFRFQLCREGR